VHGADSSFSIPFTHLSTLPCTAFPSGTVTGLHIPTLRNNLLSHRELQGVGITTIYSGFASYCDLYHTASGRFLLRIPLCPRTRLYTLRTPRPSFCHVTTRAGTSTGPLPPPPPPPPHPPVSSSSPTSSPTPFSSSSTTLSYPAVLLHHRLGHNNFAELRSSVTSRLLNSLPPTLHPLASSPAPPCPSCIHGKLKQSPHHSHPTFAAAPIALVHMDLWGPYSIRSRQGHRVALTSNAPSAAFTLTVGVSSSIIPFPLTAKHTAFSRPPPSPTPLSKTASLRVAFVRSPRLFVALLLTPPPLPLSGAMPSSMPPSSSISAPTLSIPPPPPQNSGPRPSPTLPAFVFGGARRSSSFHRPIAPAQLASSPLVPWSASTSGTIAIPQVTCSSTLPPIASSATLTSSSTSPFQRPPGFHATFPENAVWQPRRPVYGLK
ncbi:unnamed protein product, partial [Closterium sp. NIES-54]